MSAGAVERIILAMNSPPTASRVVLVADRRAEIGPATTPPVRRYRLARLRLDSRPTHSESRFDYLKRVYD